MNGSLIPNREFEFLLADEMAAENPRKSSDAYRQKAEESQFWVIRLSGVFKDKAQLMWEISLCNPSMRLEVNIQNA